MVFETLRLACLAPDTRAFVGSASPSEGLEHGRIASVAVNDRSTSWFTDGLIPINPGLVAVIGGRGSGKTALADLVAVGAGSTDPFENLLRRSSLAPALSWMTLRRAPPGVTPKHGIRCP